MSLKASRSISMFQSTPPVSGRRCLAAQADKNQPGGFNPRPPFPGGDASARHRNKQESIVSIHAPRFREAMHVDAVFVDRHADVSIHAPRFREAMPDFFKHPANIGEFQSTPPVSGRRCSITFGRGHRSTRFNPRPPFPGGDAAGERYLCGVIDVSIHAPRFREAMPAELINNYARCDVSIHAPRFREAMLPQIARRLAERWFQSTPPVSGRRCSSPVTTGSIRTKSPHYANLFIPEQKTSYAYSPPSGKPHQIRQKRGARTYRGIHVHLGFAQAHRMRGASKSVARKQPCSRTS